MSEHMSPIPSMIYNAAVGGHVTNSQQIIDENLNREQSDVNQEVLFGEPYNSTTPNGMGRIVLKKTDNFKQVVEAQTNGNTIFIIKYDFTLTSNVTIPANCVLEFDGGSISGAYTITGTNTGIQAGLVKIFNTNITLAGTWNVAEAYPEWFGAKGDNSTDDSSAIQKCVSCFDKVIFGAKTYKMASTITVSKPIEIEGVETKLVSDNPLRFFWIVSNNVIIKGLSITGVAEGYPEKDSTTARASYLINIGSDNGGGYNNIIIDNCILSDATGAVMIQPTSSNITVSNCIMKNMKYIPTSLDNPGADGAGGYGVVCHHTASASPTNNIKIYNNIFDNIPRHCVYIQKCINVDFYNNTIRNSITNVSEGNCAVHDAGVDNFNIHHNYFYEVYKGIGIANYDPSVIINPVANIHDNYFKVTELAIEMMSNDIKKLKINNNTVFGKTAFVFNNGAQICDSEIRGNYIKGSIIGAWNYGFIQVVSTKMFKNIIIDNNILINDNGNQYSACISFSYNQQQTNPIFKNVIVSNNIITCLDIPDGRGIDIQNNTHIQLLIISNNRFSDAYRPIYVGKASIENYIIVKDNILSNDPDAIDAIDVYEDNIIHA